MTTEEKLEAALEQFGDKVKREERRSDGVTRFAVNFGVNREAWLMAITTCSKTLPRVVKERIKMGANGKIRSFAADVAAFPKNVTKALERLRDG